MEIKWDITWGDLKSLVDEINAPRITLSESEIQERVNTGHKNGYDECLSDCIAILKGAYSTMGDVGWTPPPNVPAHMNHKRELLFKVLKNAHEKSKKE